MLGYWLLATGCFVHRPRVAIALAEAQVERRRDTGYLPAGRLDAVSKGEGIVD